MNDKLIEILIKARDDASATIGRVAGSVGKLDERGQGMVNTFATGTAVLTGFAAVGLGGLSLYGIKAAAGLQKTNASLGVLIGNQDTANKLFGELAVYANSTPFEFPALAKGAQVMLGFGIEEKKVMGYTRVLGDLASATGADYQSLAVVFGQVNATGKLMGQDALQLINNNIPITTMLAKRLGVSVQEVRDRMEKGAISADLFNDALVSATQKGGFAFEGTTKLAGTLEGRISTLKDAFTLLAMHMAGVTLSSRGLEVDPNGTFAKASDAVMILINGLNALPAWWDANGGKVMLGFSMLGGALLGLAAAWVVVNAAMIVAAASAALALAPFILIGAVIGGLAFLIVTRWTEIGNFISNTITAITMTVGAGLTWLRENWASALGYVIGFMVTLPLKLSLLMYQAVAGMVNAVFSVNWGSVGAAIAGGIVSGFDWIKNAAISAFNFIKGIHWGEIFTGVGKGVGNTIIDMIQGALNGALSGIPGRPQVKLPRFASGVRDFGGGLAVVGERGPELVNLPGGSDVFSNRDSQQMMNGGSELHIHVHADTVVGTERQLAETIWRELKRIDRANGQPVLPNIGVRPA